MNYMAFLPRIGFIISLGISAAGFANTEMQITSVHNGSTPYMIVVADGTGSSQRAPGLYLREGSDWKSLFTGEVLFDPRRGPLFVHPNLTRFDDRGYGLTFIDGSLHLFHLDSDPNDPSTYLKIDPKVAMAKEIGTGIKRLVPSISRFDQVSVFQGDETIMRDGTQVVLVSMKYDGMTPLGGDGLTLALVLQAGRNQKELKLKGPPLILDYQYFPTNELAQMVQPVVQEGETRDLMLHSNLLVNLALAQVEPQKYGAYQNAIEHHLGKESDILKGLIEKGQHYFKKAKYLVGEGRTEVESYVQISDNLYGYSISQTIGLLNGERRFSINRQGKRDRIERFGLIDRGPFKNLTNATFVAAADENIRSNGDYGYIIIGADGKAVAIAKNRVKDALAGLKITNWSTLSQGQDVEPLPVDIAVESVVSDRPNDSIDHLVLSVRFLKKGVDLVAAKDDDFIGTTWAVKIDQRVDGRLILEDLTLLKKRFYNDDELMSRTSRDGVDCFFDDRSAEEVSGNASRPLVDLRATTSAKGVVRKYTKAEEEISLNGYMTYKRYRPHEGVTNPTGIYYTSKDSKIVRIPGYVAPKKGSSGSSFDQLNLVDGEVVGTTMPKIWTRLYFVTDGENAEESPNFRLYLSVMWNDSSSQRHEIVALPVAGIPVNSFAGATILPWQKDHANHFTLLLAYDTDPESKESKRIRRITATTIKLDKDGNATVGPVTMVAENSSNLDEVKGLFVYDQKGALYQILTPDVSQKSRAYQVRRMSDRQIIFPKRDATGINLDFSARLIEAKAPDTEALSPLSWKVSVEQVEQRRNLRFSRAAEDLVQTDMFGDFARELEDLSDLKTPARLKVLLVPDELGDIAQEYWRHLYVSASRDTKFSQGRRFSHSNSRLSLFEPNPERVSQDAYLENMEIMGENPDRRSLLITSLKQLMNPSRPASESNDSSAFVLTELQSSGTNEAGQVEMDKYITTPHSLYLLAAGGPVALEDFRAHPPKPKGSMLLIGTKSEWRQILSEAQTEVMAGVDKAFEVKELDAPTVESKTNLLERLMTRPDIEGLRFTYDAKGISGDTKADSRRKLLEYAVTRCEAMAHNRENSFSAFVEFQALFAKSVVSDPEVRRTRVINKAFVERVITRKFNLPLNLEDLNDQHPLRMASSRNAILKLHKAGMIGPFELKAQLLKIVLAQLRPNPAKAVPSSFIFAGNPGGGKTRSWEAMVKAFGLKVYDPNKADNQDANAIYIDTAKIKKGSQAEVDKTISLLNRFMLLPNAPQGFIFIDDLTFADPALGTAIIQWLRSVLQSHSDNGFVGIPEGDKEKVRMVPVGNLTVGFAMNFTDNRAKTEEYRTDSQATFTDRLIASTSQYGLDRSLLDRMGFVINFDHFPASAKAPVLMEALLKASQELLGRRDRYVIVDPEVASLLSAAFPDMGARPFLSEATGALMEGPEKLSLSDSHSFAILPRGSGFTEAIGAEKGADSAAAEKAETITKWVQSRTRPLDMEDGLGAKLLLIKLMVGSFRTPVFESFAAGVIDEQRFDNDNMARKWLMAPSLTAIQDHLVMAQQIPLKDLNLDAKEMGVKAQSEKDKFKNLLSSLSNSLPSPFLINFNETEAGGMWSDLNLNGAGRSGERSRRDVILDYSKRLEILMRNHLHAILNVQDLKELDQIESWIRKLPKQNQVHIEKLGVELKALMFKFMEDLEDRSLKESRPGEGKPNLTPYASARFFLMSLDRAIARLPWAKVGNAMSAMLSAITRDKVLSQSVGLQNWLFEPEGSLSLLKPSTAGLLTQMVSYNESVRELNESDRERERRTFQNSCEGFLSARGN